MAVKLGAFEERVRFTCQNGEVREAVTTPAQFALADEWCDTLRAGGKHTPLWLGSRAEWATWMLAAVDEGIWDDDSLTLANVYECRSALDPVRVPDGEAGEAGNPTRADRGGDPAAQ